MDMKKISDITLERYLLKELDKDTMAQVEARLQKDPKMKARLEELRESTKKILAQYDPHYYALKISEGLKAGSEESDSRKIKRYDISSEFSNPVYQWFHQKRHALSALFSAVAVMTVIVLVLPPNMQQNTKQRSFEIAQINNDTDITRLKGDSLKLFIYRQNNSDADMLINNAYAQKGDLLQIAYFSGKQSYGMIFSIDGRGNVTVHYPLAASGVEQSFLPLKANEKVLLPTSYELDDAPDYEHFFLLASDKKINVDKILSMIKEQLSTGLYAKNKNLKFDSSMEIESLLLKKKH